MVQAIDPRYRQGAGGKATMAQVKSSWSVLSAAIIYPLRSKGGIEGGLSAAVTIEPVIESHLFLLPDEVKRPNETPDPKSDQLLSQTRPRAALFLPGLRHAHTLPFCSSLPLRFDPRGPPAFYDFVTIVDTIVMV